MSEQDTLVTNYTTAVTTDATELISAILSYHKFLGTILLDCPSLDTEHLQQLQNVPKTALFALRKYMTLLEQTVRTATEVGNF